MYGTRSGVKIAHQLGPNALAGKTVVIVGGTDGIGAALARAAAMAGAKVTVVGRSLRTKVQGVDFLKGDVSTMAECRSIVARLPLEITDVLVFTAGIVPGSEREVTAEGIEKDMAVSALSRHVMIQAAAPRLPRTARVLVWGFPGAGMLKKSIIVDFNSETTYKAGFESTHANTIALNEALVHYWAARGMAIAGFNPGLIKTAIRGPLHGGGCLGGCIESIINCFNPSAEEYASRILPLFMAPQLTTSKGLLFHQDGCSVIKPDAGFQNPATVAEWITAADRLVTKSAGPTTPATLIMS
jgi:NAD(P)-dependent dehydrogenase (short-subunit alcohol dehydrogenase family)